MEAVRARLQGDAGNGAGLPAVFRLRVLLCAEFLDGIHRQQGRRVARETHGVDGALATQRFHCGDSVEDINVVLGPQTVCRLCPCAAAGIDGHAGAELQQVHKIVAIQRQILDSSRAQSAAQRRRCGVDQRNFARYGDRAHLLARFQREIDFKLFANFQRNVRPLNRLEALIFDPDPIVSGRQAGHVVSTSFVGSQGSRGAPLEIRHRHLRADNCEAGLIPNAAQNTAGIALREQRRCQNE